MSGLTQSDAQPMCGACDGRVVQWNRGGRVVELGRLVKSLLQPTQAGTGAVLACMCWHDLQKPKTPPGICPAAARYAGVGAVSPNYRATQPGSS